MMKDVDVKVGMRVRVAIADYDRYAQGAARALDGKAGLVEAVNDRVPPRQYRVRFDVPGPTWWGRQTAPTAWWFDATDLEPTS